MCTCLTFDTQNYIDWCKEAGIDGHECLDTIGRFTGSRHHNQFLPGVKVYNAILSVFGFLVFWEGRKVKKAPNRMFTANKRALSCKRTRFEFEVIGSIYWLFISPMLAIMAGRVESVKSNIDLVPVVSSLLSALESATEDSIFDLLKGKCSLIPQFDEGQYERQQLSDFRFEVHVMLIIFAYAPKACSPTMWMRLNLAAAPDAARDIAHVQCLKKIFPRFAQKLRDRQPHLCPGGKYADLSASAREEVSNAKPTSDIMGNVGEAATPKCPSSTHQAPPQGI